MKWSFLLVLGGVLLSQDVLAQPLNSEIYRNLLQNLQKETGPVQYVRGKVLSDFMPDFEIDSLADYGLELYSPVLQYKKIDRQQIHRSLRISLSLKGDEALARTLIFEDTLQNRELRRIHRKSEEPLRTALPLPMSRWGKPILMISLSISAVLGLFYIRSRPI